MYMDTISGEAAVTAIFVLPIFSMRVNACWKKITHSGANSFMSKPVCRVCHLEKQTRSHKSCFPL